MGAETGIAPNGYGKKLPVLKPAAYEVSLKSDKASMRFVASSFRGVGSRYSQLEDYARVNGFQEITMKLLSQKQEKALRRLKSPDFESDADRRTFNVGLLDLELNETFADQLNACEWCPMRMLLAGVADADAEGLPPVGENCRSIQDGLCAVAEYAVENLVSNNRGK
jgi:hypothetical protein